MTGGNLLVRCVTRGCDGTHIAVLAANDNRQAINAKALTITLWHNALKINKFLTPERCWSGSRYKWHPIMYE